MNIVVCVKQIPDPAMPGQLDPGTKTLKREGKLIMDESDSFGVEMGLQLAEKAGGGEVTIVSMVPAAGVQGIRSALAMGAAKAILVSDDALVGTDALGIVTHGLITGAVPLAWGTSIEQAVTMATQAGLSLALVLEGGSTGGGSAVAVHVAAIDTLAEHYGNNKGHRVTRTVTVRDADGAVAPGVSVSIDVTTPAGTEAAQGTTGSNGQVALTVQVAGATTGHGTWTSCVTSLSGPGYTYDSLANVETCQGQTVN